ncbi:MAG: sugar transferase [Candidatus Moranbacteria bacterium]|nr:sugar transferase [Candidatus Moranbacteria bacterium]
MKKSELFFSAFQVPVDFAMIILAAITAFAIRDIPQILALKPKLYNFPFESYVEIALLVAPFFILIYALEGLYDIRSTRKIWKEIVKVFVATSIGLVIIIVAIFLKREWFSSRFIILAGWFFMVVYVVIARFILQNIQKVLLVKKGIGIHRVLLIGRNGKIDEIGRVIKEKPKLGYKIVGQIDTGSVKAVKQIRGAEGVDEIIVCDPTLTDAEQEKLVDYCAINNVSYKFIPTTLQTSQLEIGMLDGEPIIEVQHTPLEGWGRILKRIFDIAGSAALIIIFSPVMIVTAIIIWLEGEGPIIYKNERIGNDGKKFYACKFRYMKWRYSIHRDNPNLKEALEYEQELIRERSVRQGPLYKIKNDPRKTTFGKFIEKYSIDELPQFFNVLKGDMSLVGPRPHQEREVEKYREYHRRLLTIKPGITGMAQVAGRSDLDFEDEYKMDVYYIENWSLWLDIQLCLKTVGVIFRRRKN